MQAAMPGFGAVMFTPSRRYIFLLLNTPVEFQHYQLYICVAFHQDLPTVALYNLAQDPLQLFHVICTISLKRDFSLICL